MDNNNNSLTLAQILWISGFNILLTAIINLIFQWLKIKFEWFDNTKKFKRDFYYEQLKELYLNLYAIIAQSEYLRYFFNIEKDFNKLPFLEIEKKTYESKINLSNGSVKSKTFDIKDAVSEFNKEKIDELILEKCRYASQDLLKLAVAYRYVYQHYLDKKIEKEQLDKFQLEELNLINKIVKIVIKETNEKLKICKMNYNSDELETGNMDDKIFKNS